MLRVIRTGVSIGTLVLAALVPPVDGIPPVSLELYVDAADLDPQDAPVSVSGATISDDVRRVYAEYWASLPEEKAVKLERRLQELERRAARGDNVQQQIRQLRQQEPRLARLSRDELRWSRAPGLPAGGGDIRASAVGCSGIGWIGRDGEARCAGKYVVSKLVGRPK